MTPLKLLIPSRGDGSLSVGGASSWQRWEVSINQGAALGVSSDAARHGDGWALGRSHRELEQTDLSACFPAPTPRSCLSPECDGGTRGERREEGKGPE